MAAYTFTTNDEQEQALQAALSRKNTERAQSDPPMEPLSAGEFLFRSTREVLVGLVTHMRNTEDTEIAELLKVAPPERRAAVLRALGR
jgi:hypothetical protein